MHSSHGFGRHAFAHAGPALGVEPAIEADGRRHAAAERRLVSKRWLAGTVLTGVAGAALIGAAIDASLSRHAIRVQPASYASTSGRGDAVRSDTSLPKGDRLVKKVDVIAEKQSFKAPTAVTVGDKQVLESEAHVLVPRRPAKA